MTVKRHQRVLVLPSGPGTLSGLGTVLTVCPVPRTGLPARSAAVLLDSGEKVLVPLEAVL